MVWRGPILVLKLSAVSGERIFNDGVRYILFEGAGGYAAAACAGLKMHPARSRDAIPGEAGSVPARNELAITGHAGGASVEERTALGIVGVVSPVVVWKRTLAAALASKHLLEGPGKVAMPRQEVTSAVNIVRLLNVCHDEIIVATLCARCNRRRGLCGQLVETVNGIGKLYSLLARECCPTRCEYRQVINHSFGLLTIPCELTLCPAYKYPGLGHRSSQDVY